MTTPSGDDIGLAAKIMGGMGAALSALGAWAWAHTHARIDRKADKEAFDKLSAHIETHMIGTTAFSEHTKSDERQLEQLNVELATQRGHIGKLFDELAGLRKDTSEQLTTLERIGTTQHLAVLDAIREIKR